MYNQLIYFIVVLLLFSVQHQTGKQPPALLPDALYIAALFGFFIFYCRRAFEKILKAADRGVPFPVLTHAYYRAQALLSITAIGFLAVYLYGFNLGAYLNVIPGYDKFMTISGIAGLAIFLVHLAVIWFWSHPVHQVIFGTRSSRTHFIKGQLSFASVILIPWFLISIVADLLQFIKTPSFMATDVAQLLLISLALIGFVLFGPWLIIRMWRCKPIRSDYVKDELEKFCSDHDFRTGGLLLWSVFGAETLTAGVVGILPRFRYILITSGLLRTLDVAELEAVLAHEMGHVRKKHLLLFVFLLILFILLVYDLSSTVTMLALSNKTIFDWSVASGNLASSAFSLLSALPVILLVIFFFRFVFGYFLRNSERQADLYAMELIGDPRPLISSLEKIAFHSGNIEDLPSWHHYSIRQRVEFLVEAFGNRDRIRRHNRKLYGSALIFVAAISGLLLINWRAEQSGFARDLRAKIEFRMQERALSRGSGNAEYLAQYGAFLYEKGRYSEAESVLRAAIVHDPDNASALNNLAWLYATGPSPFRKPRKALDLAQKAAALSPAPDILDTLAEAYYINGRYSEAIATIDEAIAEDGPQKSYLLKQKEKFEKALSEGMRSL